MTVRLIWEPLSNWRGMYYVLPVLAVMYHRVRYAHEFTLGVCWLRWSFRVGFTLGVL